MKTESEINVWKDEFDYDFNIGVLLNKIKSSIKVLIISLILMVIVIIGIFCIDNETKTLPQENYIKTTSSIENIDGKPQIIFELPDGTKTTSENLPKIFATFISEDTMSKFKDVPNINLVETKEQYVEYLSLVKKFFNLIWIGEICIFSILISIICLVIIFGSIIFDCLQLITIRRFFKNTPIKKIPSYIENSILAYWNNIDNGCWITKTASSNNNEYVFLVLQKTKKGILRNLYATEEINQFLNENNYNNVTLDML